MHGLDHLRHADDRDGPPEIIGKRGQAEFAAHLIKPSHQESPLVHPLLDRPKRMFDRLASNIEDLWPGSEALSHAIEHCLAFPSRDAAEVSACALGLERAPATYAGVEYCTIVWPFWIQR